MTKLIATAPHGTGTLGASATRAKCQGGTAKTSKAGRSFMVHPFELHTWSLGPGFSCLWAAATSPRRF